MTTPQYDFGTLYGQADNSNLLYPEQWTAAVVEEATFGRNKDGTRGQWTIRHRTAEGPSAGVMPVTGYIPVMTVDPASSPDDQAKARRGIGMMFRRLAALGIPVPDPKDPTKCVNGDRPFWMLGWTEEQVAQVMKGKPTRIKIYTDNWEGNERSKISDWQPPLPGAPTTWPQTPAQAPAQQGFGGGGFAQPAAPQGYGQPPQGFAQPAQPQWAQPPAPQQPMMDAPNPVFPGQVVPQAPPQGWQPPQGPQQPPQPAAPQWGAPPQQPQQPQQVPGAPAWAQPAQPGQGGTAEFTPQGMSQQPAYQNGQGQPQAPQGVPQPPWAQQGPPQGQPQWNGQPQAAPSPPADTAPPVPPWAQ